MATRLYRGINAAQNLRFTQNAIWSNAPVDFKRLHTTKFGAEPSVTNNATSLVGTINYVFQQLISPPLYAQTISGTFKGEMFGFENTAAADAHMQCVVRVIRNDTTVVGTLIAGYSGSLINEFSTFYSSKTVPVTGETTVDSVTVQNGDYIVIETGYKKFSTSAIAVGYSYHSISGSVDIPFGDSTSTDTTQASWFEFSQTLNFLTESIGSLAPRQHTNEVASFLSLEEQTGSWVPQGSYAQESLGDLFSGSYFPVFSSENNDNLSLLLMSSSTAFIDNNQIESQNLNLTLELTNLYFSGSSEINSDVGYLDSFGTGSFPNYTSENNDNLSLLLMSSSTFFIDNNIFTNRDLADTLLSEALSDDPENIYRHTSVGSSESTTFYVNRVYNTTTNKFVRWVTTFPDTSGLSYPGPGAFGVNTTDYVLESNYTI